MRISTLLLFISIGLSALGGLSDITGRRIFGVSREHYWSDAMYLVGLALAVNIILRI